MIWHSTAIDEIVEQLESNDQSGLTEKKAAKKAKEFGFNQVYSVENESLWKHLKEQLLSSTFIIGIIAAVFYFVFDLIFNNGTFRVPAVIVFTLVCYVFVVAAVETLTNKRIIANTQVTKSKVTVLRDGKKRTINAKYVVPGDILFLNEGDYIPADARLIESNNLRCDEALITGNVTTVEKNHAFVCPDIESIENRANMVYAGCCVAFGEAKAIVTDTGSHTERGKKITELLREENVITPIQTKVKKTMKVVTTAFIILSAVFFCLGMFIGRTRFDWREFVLLATLLFSVTVPCSYSLLVTFNLVMGMRRARRKQCEIKKVENLETMCATNVIICDKTGTLTQDKMKATKAFVNGTLYDIDNFSPEEVTSMLKIAALSCDGDVEIDDFGREKHFGDTVETSILSATFKVLKTDKLTLDSTYPRMGEIPLDAVRKLKTVICVIDGKPFAIVKGVSEIVIDKCIDVDKDSLLKTTTELSKQAYRVIGIAYKQLDELPAIPSAELIENDLTFCGLIAIANLPRFDAKVELEECTKLGIKTIMLTGDNIDTATAAAKKLDLLDENSVCVDGEMLQNMSEEELNDKFQNIVVYASISAEQRLMIVEKWQALGKTVAITGDSVADAFALKQADVGCAMGSGTQLAKSASEVVITDDSYTGIVKGLKEIKGMYLNIRNSLKQFVSVSFALAISMILGLFFFKTSVITPMLLVFAGLFYNSISSFCIAFQPAHRKVLQRQIYKNDNIVGGVFQIDVAVGIIAMVLASLVAYYFGNRYGFGIEYYYTVFVSSALFLGFSNRSEDSFYTVEMFKNPLLDFSYAFAGLVLSIMVMFRPAAAFLKIQHLEIDQVIKCFILALIVPAINESYKILKKKFIK